jgi:hypothetical protein
MRTFNTTVSVAAIIFAFTFFLVAAPPASAVTVYFSSPSSSTVTTSFSLRANATSGYPITGWAVYVDGNKVWGTAGPTSSISTTVNVGTGSHNLHVTAWDNSGGSGYKAMTITASGSSGTDSTSSGSLPTPPSSAKVFSSIENMGGFKACSANCAGGHSTTNYWMAQFQGSPSLDGSSTQFFNGGSAYANVLWYKELGAYNYATKFLWDFWARFDSSIHDLHSAEYDLYQSINGMELMVGSQCSFGNNRWDLWNQASGSWVPTSIPCPRWSSGSWHHIQWYVQRVSSYQYKYVTLVVDGKAYSINRTFSGSRAGWADKVGVQWQIDLGPNGVDSHEWIDKVKLTIW